MSYTEIYQFNKDGDAEFLGEAKNSHAGAGKIWDILERKYLPSLPKPHYANVLALDDEYWSRRGGGGDMNEVWDLVSNPDVSEVEKVVLASTFDNTIIRASNIGVLLKYYRYFDKEHSGTNLLEQISIIEGMDGIAIGFNQTSVNGGNWSNFGEYDNIKDESSPYNLFDGNLHHYLFDD